MASQSSNYDSLESLEIYLESDNIDFDNDMLNFILSNQVSQEYLYNLINYKGENILFYAVSLYDFGRNIILDGKYLNNIERLINIGGEPFVNYTNTDKHNALMYHAYNTDGNIQLQLMQIFINAGIDLNEIDTNGETVLFPIVSFAHTPTNMTVLRLALDNGADVNIQNMQMETPLMVAAQSIIGFSASPQIIQILLEYGANKLLVNSEGETAYDIINDQVDHDHAILHLLQIQQSSVSSPLTYTPPEQNSQSLLPLQDDNIAGPSNLLDGFVQGQSQDQTQYQSYDNAIDDDFESDDDSDLTIETSQPGEIYTQLYDADSQPGEIYTQLYNADEQFEQESPEDNIDDSILDDYIYVKDADEEGEYIRLGVNLTKELDFTDPITMEDTNVKISEYIKEDPDNLVFVYDVNRYFLSKRSIINMMRRDATLYPCFVLNSMNPTNINTNKQLFNLLKIGFVSGYPCIMTALYTNPNKQLFSIFSTNKQFHSFISHDVLHQGSMVSGLHCQEGSGSKISILQPAYPSLTDNLPQTGGKKRKHKKKHSKKTRGNKTRVKKTHGRRKHKKKTRKNKSHHKKH